MPEKYRVELVASARKELEALHEPLISRILTALRSLAFDPRPRGSKKLTGERSKYRIRIGDFRAIYEVSDSEMLIIVYKIRHRREVYD